MSQKVITNDGKRSALRYNRPRSAKKIQKPLRRVLHKQIKPTRKTHKKLSRGKTQIMANERITEDYVRSHFKLDPLFQDIKLEEQRTSNKRIKELLKTASKKGSGKPGYPEFIITFPAIMNAVILVECKPNLKNHGGIKDGENPDPERYAIDGVLHYAKFLKSDYNVIAIAVSGERREQLLVSQFLIKKGSNVTRTPDNKLLTIYDYLSIFEGKETADELKDKNLLVFASELNEKLRNYSVPENERATIVSGILIALQNKAFRTSYAIEQKPSDLVEDLLKAIERVLKAKNMGSKTKILMGEYSKISQSSKLAISEKIRNNETGEEEKNTLLRNIIYDIERNVLPFTEYKHIGYDILGQFYSEFIRYVNGDKKLGLVLTPKHVTELFVDIANLNVNSVMYDNCCGTAGFLIRAMEKLMELAGNDEAKKQQIREHQLFGVEERTDMFTYACSNMMMRGDGKSNIILGDSLGGDIKEQVKEYNPTIGFLNPPYATNVSELEFIYHNLECLENNGICVGIIPISCVTATSGSKDFPWKQKLLEKHTLEAVFSMPIELFNPATSSGPVITVFRAHVPNPKDHETYFGLWADDGFIKVKHLGRVDYHGKWKGIKEGWIYNYRNKREIKEHSVKKCVKANDEWCAEAYLETDYSDINREDFEEEIKKYVLYQELNRNGENK